VLNKPRRERAMTPVPEAALGAVAVARARRAYATMKFFGEFVEIAAKLFVVEVEAPPGRERRLIAEPGRLGGIKK
jgi:hypothetical protein